MGGRESERRQVKGVEGERECVCKRESKVGGVGCEGLVTWFFISFISWEFVK